MVPETPPGGVRTHGRTRVSGAAARRGFPNGSRKGAAARETLSAARSSPHRILPEPVTPSTNREAGSATGNRDTQNPTPRRLSERRGDLAERTFFEGVRSLGVLQQQPFSFIEARPRLLLTSPRSFDPLRDCRAVQQEPAADLQWPASESVSVSEDRQIERGPDSHARQSIGSENAATPCVSPWSEAGRFERGGLKSFSEHRQVEHGGDGRAERRSAPRRSFDGISRHAPSPCPIQLWGELLGARLLAPLHAARAEGNSQAYVHIRRSPL